MSDGLSWDANCDLFVWEGAWLDLYIVPADEEIWRRALQLVEAPGYFSELWSPEGHVRPWPPLERLFDGIASLKVSKGGLVFHCHFFAPAVLEFWIDPRQVTSGGHFRTLCEFMTDLGRACDRDVRLTPENSVDHPLLLYSRRLDSVHRVGL
jgi:hypothetical protein